MLMLKDTVVQDILQFLECCEGIIVTYGIVIKACQGYIRNKA